MTKKIDESCADSGCHGTDQLGRLPKTSLIKFADQTKETFDCLNKSENATAKQKLDNCLRSGSGFKQQLGVFRAVANDDVMLKILREGGATEPEISKFKALAMPPGVDSLMFDSMADWEHVRDWLAAQPSTYAGINQARPDIRVSGIDCKQSISADLTKHLQKSTGPDGVSWVTVHRQTPLPMFGCPEKTDFPAHPVNCLTQFSEKPEWAAADGVAGSKVRILRELPGFTNYWTRSSPDGRFVGNGGYSGPNAPASTAKVVYSASIDDLAVADRRIVVNAEYDPGFSPDNQRFMFVGMICPLQQLKNTALKSVNGNDAASGCFSQKIGTYQSIGAEVGVADRFTVVKPQDYLSDDGGTTNRGSADALELFDTTLHIHTFVKGADGGFADTVADVPMKGESQSSISPSGALIIQRFTVRGLIKPKNDEDSKSDDDSKKKDSGDTDKEKPANGGSGELPANVFALDDGALDDSTISPTFDYLVKKSGYHIRFIDKLRTDGAKYDLDADPSVSTLCIKGNKAMFSYDDRFVVTHHYADQQDDAANAGLYSNLYLYDLLTGKNVQITNMKPGTYALYPHFRADGWIYFLVREWNGTARKDYIAATDAALLIK